MRVTILHGYSAENAGDGLLIEEAVELVREAFGEATEIVVFMRYPASIDDPGFRVVCSRWRSRTAWTYVRELATLSDSDLVMAVGGGYLRFGRALESVKTSFAHLPQLCAAAVATAPSVYLPQSVGPLRFGTRRTLNGLLGRIDQVIVRDDRSRDELSRVATRRMPDMALLGFSDRMATQEVDPVPVLSVRRVSNRAAPRIARLARLLGEYDGYVQSTVAGNDDTRHMAALAPRTTLPRGHLMDEPPVSRVVIAVRLHAALMALRAGHYVVHLAYERKGFGAFEDLGLGEYVFNVNGFDPSLVEAVARSLLESSEAREAYDANVRRATMQFGMARASLVDDLRRLAGPPDESTR